LDTFYPSFPFHRPDIENGSYGYDLYFNQLIEVLRIDQEKLLKGFLLFSFMEIVISE